MKTVAGGLNGTITVHESGNGTTSVNDGVIGKDQTTVTVNHVVTFNVIDGRAIAKVSYDHTTTKVSLLKYDQHSVTGTRKESIIAGGTSATANVGIDLRERRHLSDFLQHRRRARHVDDERDLRAQVRQWRAIVQFVHHRERRLERHK